MTTQHGGVIHSSTMKTKIFENNNKLFMKLQNNFFFYRASEWTLVALNLTRLSSAQGFS